MDCSPYIAAVLAKPFRSWGDVYLERIEVIRAGYLAGKLSDADAVEKMERWITNGRQAAIQRTLGWDMERQETAEALGREPTLEEIDSFQAEKAEAEECEIILSVYHSWLTSKKPVELQLAAE